jgi:adenosylcobinamide kinase/adenosylcobinamide-phosphate guanylyltransferase
MGSISLITGGVRSGKSAWALKRAEDSRLFPRTFIATAETLDDEMKKRAATHQAERGESWRTVEEPLAIARILRELPDSGVTVVDCLTVWLGNIWHHHGSTDQSLGAAVEGLVKALDLWCRERSGRVILVSNEVGWGIVPIEPAVRCYRDWSGRMNQRVAALADEVYLSVAGIPMRVKQEQS